MLLSTMALIVGLATGTLVAAVSTLLPSLLAKIITGGIFGAGSTGWWLHRRRTRRQSAEAAVSTASTGATATSTSREPVG